MLRSIDIRHFKCFTRLKLPLRPLTLLSGRNSSGKSSVLHALVLLHQTIREHEWSTRLMLNGSAVCLGTVADVIDEAEGRRTIAISIEDNDLDCYWEFDGDRSEMSMPVKRAKSSRGGDTDVTQATLRHLLPLPQNKKLNDDSLQLRLLEMSYLTAERLGPRESYPLVDPWHGPVVGSKGEHSVGILYNGGNERVLDGLIVPDTPPTRLRQTEARMRQLFPGCELAVDKVARANAVTLGLRTSNDTGFHRPVHTGFGLTQVLPIIVAALSAKRNGLLLIENPEVHLHPAGQATMGKFLTEVAAAGVQVLIETHSDHVLNGIRRSVKDGTLSHQDAALHYFRPRGNELNGLPQVSSPIMSHDGSIDSWPDGFFDQIDKDTDYFAGWS